jgi:hypothetical protein
MTVPRFDRSTNMRRPGFTYSLARAFALVTGIVAPASAAVHVIDSANGPGTDFVHPSAAHALVAPGDVLVVRDGVYHDVEWSATPVTFIAEAGHTPKFTNTVVSNLPPGTDTVFRGIRFESEFTTCDAIWSMKGLRLDAVQGALLFEDCIVEGGRPAVEAVGCSSVTFARSSIIGGGPLFGCLGGAPGAPGPGVVSTNSVLHLQSSTVEGGPGYDAAYSGDIPGAVNAAQTGASAVRVEGGELFCGRSQLAGGDGGDGLINGLALPPFDCVPAKAGGAGLEITAAGGIVRLLDTTIEAGPSGDSPGSCSPPLPGSSIVQNGGMIVTLAGESNSVIAPAPAREGESTALTIAAPAGQVVIVFVAIDFTANYFPASSSVLHIGAQASVASLGLMPPGGVLTIPVVIPAGLPVGGSARAFVQAANCDMGTGQCRLGSPSAAVILDASL